MTGLRLFAGVFAVLAAAVAAEVADRPTGDVESPAASTQHATAAAPAAAALPDATHSEAWSATLLARPLFAPDRRPVPGPAAPVAHDVPLPRLSGIVLSPDLRFAIFEGEHATRAIIVADGGAIEGWTVATIAADSVTLARDGSQSVMLRPHFAAGTGVAGGTRVAAVAPPPRPPPVSRWVNPAATGILRSRWSNPQLQPRRRRGADRRVRRRTA
jgi:hypothetical protein